MHKTLVAYLQLVRLPNVLTAAADSLAGWLLVGGSLSDPRSWPLLATSSMVLYASGTALNDVFDFAIDRRERPGRPLPSGRVSRAAAAWIGGLGLVIGPAVAAASGSLASGFVATVLALVILAYDAGIKHTWLGPVLMGGCRGLNLLLGMSHVPGLAGPIGWYAAVGYGLYVAGITVVSRSETEGGRHGGLLIGLAIQILAILGLTAVALSPGRFPHADIERPVIALEGLLVFALVTLAVSAAASRAIRHPTPVHIQKWVKTGILSLVWLHVGLIAAVRGPEAAVPIALLWFPAFILARWLYAT
jgi:4-hydroxybenzoate polyprenyltransferase